MYPSLSKTIAVECPLESFSFQTRAMSLATIVAEFTYTQPSSNGQGRLWIVRVVLPASQATVHTHEAATKPVEALACHLTTVDHHVLNRRLLEASARLPELDDRLKDQASSPREQAEFHCVGLAWSSHPFDSTRDLEQWARVQRGPIIIALSAKDFYARHWQDFEPSSSCAGVTAQTLDDLFSLQRCDDPVHGSGNAQDCLVRAGCDFQHRHHNRLVEEELDAILQSIQETEDQLARTAQQVAWFD